MLDEDMTITVAPISQDEPCGEALDYDLDFLDLEIMARGRPERQTGDSISPGEQADWQAVAELAGRLTERAHDIRLELYLARADLALTGLDALGRRLSRLAVLIDTYWPKLHPCPEDDDDDETVRLNALGDLADPDGLMAQLRDLTLVQSRRAGSFSLRDWNASRYDDGAGTAAQQIVAALAETEPAQHDAMAAGLTACQDGMARIETAIRNHIPPQDAPKLAPLGVLLGQMLEMLAPYLSQPAEPEPGTDAPDQPVAGTATVPVAGGGRGGPNSRDDVVAMLDRICAWYRLNEPASPVPALLERARQLVAKDFLTLLQELAPEGAAQFRHLAGLKPSRPADDD